MGSVYFALRKLRSPISTFLLVNDNHLYQVNVPILVLKPLKRTFTKEMLELLHCIMGYGHITSRKQTNYIVIYAASSSVETNNLKYNIFQ